MATVPGHTHTHPALSTFLPAQQDHPSIIRMVDEIILGVHEIILGF